VTHQAGSETGRLTAVGSDSLTLEVPATKKTPARQVTLDLDAVQRGIVQVEFKRADSGDDTAATDDPDETSALEGDH
jgi:ribosome maturation factor RimP